MCRSDGLIGLSSTRTSASPGAKGGVGISASFNTLFGSPVSRKINAFINTSWVFRRRLIPAACSTTSGTRTGAGDEGEHLRRSWEMLHALAEPNLPQCHSLGTLSSRPSGTPASGQTALCARRAMSGENSCAREGSHNGREPHATSRMTFHRETRHHWYPHKRHGKILLYERYRAPNWKSVHSSAWMKLFATRSKRKFNNPVSFDEKR